MLIAVVLQVELSECGGRKRVWKTGSRRQTENNHIQIIFDSSMLEVLSLSGCFSVAHFRLLVENSGSSVCVCFQFLLPSHLSCGPVLTNVACLSLAGLVTKAAQIQSSLFHSHTLRLQTQPTVGAVTARPTPARSHRKRANTGGGGWLQVSC